MGRRMGNPNELQVVNIRMVKEPSLYSEDKIRCPEDAVRVIAKELATYDREVFAVLNLKTNGQPISFNICSVGTLDASLVSPANTAKSGILANAAAQIAIHVHPSGSLEPSQEDKDVTKRLIAAADIIGIRLLDHIIVAGGTGEVFSFKNEGLMDQLTSRHKAWER